MSLKTRWILILTIVAASLVGVWPNFIPLTSKLDKTSFAATNRIVEGLDIQGGLQLVMGVDVDGVLKEKMARLPGQLKESFEQEGLKHGDIKVAPDHDLRLHISFSTADEATALARFIEQRDHFGILLQVLEQRANTLVLQFLETSVITYRTQIIEQAIEVVRDRIDEFGVAEPSISSQGSDRILVQLPGIQDTAGAKELIHRAARLNFRGVSKKMEADELNNLIGEAEKAGNYSLGAAGLTYKKYIERLNDDLKSKLPENTRVLFERNAQAETLVAGRQAHLIEIGTELGGEHLEDAVARPDEFGRYEVVFRFSPEGRRLFAELTEKTSPGFLAIVLDDVVKSAPSVKEKIDSQQARITLGAGDYQQTVKEATFIATALRAGSLPAALEQLEERTVGPTLGADSIAAGKRAGMVAAVLVLLFMLLYYKRLGVVANVALILNMLFVFAILSSLGATLTLPGVAGLILTLGMAVDANVIIFERVREELGKGSSVRAAIHDGFGHAMSAIMDANVTTAAVCIVLMYFGTGPVRGFAVTLICGIVTSLFAAIFVSRTVIETKHKAFI